MAGARSVVEEGLALLEAQRSGVLPLDAVTLDPVAGNLSALLSVLLARVEDLHAQNVSLRAELDQLCAKVDHVGEQVLATRIRRAVRDEMGAILYVVDEIQVADEPEGDDDDGYGKEY